MIIPKIKPEADKTFGKVHTERNDVVVSAWFVYVFVKNTKLNAMSG